MTAEVEVKLSGVCYANVNLEKMIMIEMMIINIMPRSTQTNIKHCNLHHEAHRCARRDVP